MQIRATLTALLAAAFMVGGASAADAALPRPDRNDPSIITQAGHYTQEQADANRATYLALQDYVDEREAIFRSFHETDQAFIQRQQEIMLQRDQDNAAALNEQRETILVLTAERDTARLRVAHKAAKIAELRAIIRGLRTR